MVNIAICDDEVKIRKQYISTIEENFEIQEMQITEFSSGEEFVFFLEDHLSLFDIVIMDIEMNEMNGIQTMTKARELGYKGELIYSTMVKEYVFDSFDTKPLNYILKNPWNQELFVATIDKALSASGNKIKESIIVKIASEQKRVFLDEIMYISSFLRKITIVLKNKDNVESYTKLSAILEELKSDDFMQVHKSYIINFNYVKQVKGSEITMTSGDVIPVGRSALAEFKKRFAERLSKRAMI